MKDYLNIGSAPYGEDCAQLGSDGYETRARRECETFIQQIRRELGPEPGKARLKTKSFPHDFGNYFEVVVQYEDLNEVEMEYAFNVESNSPEDWDDESLKILEIER